MPVAGHQQGPLGRGQGDQVVITWVFGPDRGGPLGVWGERPRRAKPPHERGGVPLWDATPKLGVAERSLELNEQRLGEHQLEGALLPMPQ